MSSIPDTTAAENSLPLGKRSAVREIRRSRLRAFFVVMALVVAAVVVYGFSFTVRANLLEPPYPRPAILYLHVLLFATWVPLFFAQTVLVQARRVDLHRRLGVWGLVHGSLIPLVGITTAIVMARLHAIHGEVEAVYAFPFPCYDMIAFTAAFGLGAAWRRRPELHRRLMWIATAILTGAAFGRIPGLDQGTVFYFGVDALILLGALRDFVVLRRVHRVYWIGLVALIAGQLVTRSIYWSPAWRAMALRVFG